MKRMIAKLAFVHRRSWRDDKTYRAAVLLGPPPLLGAALAAMLWAGLHALGPPVAHVGQSPPWAHPQEPISGAPFAAEPVAALPGSEEDGKFNGLATGWQGLIQPVQISPTLDVNVLRERVATFTIDKTAIDMAQIVAAGPSSSLYVGVETALLAIKTAGSYGLSVRVERSSFRIRQLSRAARLCGAQVDIRVQHQSHRNRGAQL